MGENEENMDGNEENMDKNDETMEKNEENLNKSKENKYGEDSGHSSVEEGNDNKKSEPFCTEGITSEKECKETATKWCKSRHCENGFVGKCQYKSKENSCCKKYRCKKHDKAQQNDVGSKLGPGETIVHYSFHGSDKLSKILRPHHCNRTNICPALVDKEICDNSVLGCETEFSCEDDNCKCIVITSCKSEENQSFLNPNNIDGLGIYGATRFSINRNDGPKCDNICESEVEKASDKICNNNKLSSCSSKQICKEKCSCWVNIGCRGQNNGSNENQDEVDNNENQDEVDNNENEDVQKIQSNESDNDDKQEKQDDENNSTKMSAKPYDESPNDDEQEQIGHDYSMEVIDGGKVDSKSMQLDNENQEKEVPFPPLMYTEKVTMYIGRDSIKKMSDTNWHKKAENKCKTISARFDLGCSVTRTSQSHVFCMVGYCVCYIQYEKCSSTANEQNIDKDKYAEGSGEEDVIAGDDNKDNDKSKDGIRVDEDNNLDDDLQEKIEIENRSVKPDDDNDQGTEGSGVDKSEGIEIEEDPSENVKLEDLMDSTNDENEGINKDVDDDSIDSNKPADEASVDTYPENKDDEQVIEGSGIKEDTDVDDNQTASKQQDEIEVGKTTEQSKVSDQDAEESDANESDEKKEAEDTDNEQETERSTDPGNDGNDVVMGDGPLENERPGESKGENMKNNQDDGAGSDSEIDSTDNEEENEEKNYDDQVEEGSGVSESKMTDVDGPASQEENDNSNIDEKNKKEDTVTERSDMDGGKGSNADEDAENEEANEEHGEDEPDKYKEESDINEVKTTERRKYG